MAQERVVVVGSSSGGIRALQHLAAQLGPDFPAPILAVQHVGSHPSILPSLLARKGALPASHAADGDIVRPGHILVAPPDQHMLLEGDRVRLTRGPKENHTRPAIDPLFRTAAFSRGAGVIGVLLTGGLDDGTAGLQAIAQAGGTTVVQDPADAEVPGMPTSAIRYVKVDHVVALESMGELLRRVVREPAGASRPPDKRTVHEHQMLLRKGNPIEHLKALGEPSTFTCPDCQGALWRIDHDPARFRCHTGHGYTLRSLQDAQHQGTDDALWSALRAIQEKQELLRSVARETGEAHGARLLEEVEELEQHAEVLRRLVEHMRPAQGTA